MTLAKEVRLRPTYEHDQAENGQCLIAVRTAVPLCDVQVAANTYI